MRSRKLLTMSSTNMPLNFGSENKPNFSMVFSRLVRLNICWDMVLIRDSMSLVTTERLDRIREIIAWLTGTELFPAELYYLSELPAEMDTGETTTVVIMALVLSILATVYPSWRASRLDPVEALRYE